MPPAVLPDSDDDSDDNVVVACEDAVSTSRGSRGNAAAGTTYGCDGATDGSANSAELLRRQIQSAERGLLSNTAPPVQHQNSSASPARQAAKRRHTTVPAAESSASPQKGVKRTKTMKTYGGAGRRPVELAGTDDFSHFRDDKEDAPDPASQVARISAQSGPQSSVPLPTGTLQADFMNNDPVMFKDTGDTVADRSSEQQRLLEAALASKRGLAAALSNEGQLEEEQGSSSIPWTASDIANSAMSKKGDAAREDEVDRKLTGPADTAQRGTDMQHKSFNADEDTQTTAATARPAADEHGGDNSAASDLLRGAKEDEFSLRKPKSSPVVEIPRQSSPRSTSHDEQPRATQRATKGRKQTAQTVSSEPLNSEDAAIGLPKERYKPRPTRRRATHTVEELIDYSVVPEKAAKIKRTKTTGAKAEVASKTNDSLATQSPKPDPCTPDSESNGGPKSTSEQEGHWPSKDGLTAGKTDKHKDTVLDEVKPPAAHDGESSPPVKRRRTIKQREAESRESQTVHEEPPASPLKMQKPSQEDREFVKPAIPASKTKSSSKVKRAHTTIYEDHVEFLGSQRSPTLSQQQATRKAALQDVSNEAAPKSSRKRKSIVADDSDVEDELAKENKTVPETSEPVVKKRRGRPSKADKEAQQRATESATHEAEMAKTEQQRLSQQAEVHANASDDDGNGEPPSKRSRGEARGSGPTSAKETDASEEFEAPSADSDAAARTPAKPSAGEMPTPSPEKPSAEKAATPPKAASARPASHSPIKSSLKAPLRVGLSKSHRIPPLLRVMSKPAPTKR